MKGMSFLLGQPQNHMARAEKIIETVDSPASWEGTFAKRKPARLALENVAQAAQRAADLSLIEMKQQGASPAQADMSAGAKKTTNRAGVFVWEGPVLVCFVHGRFLVATRSQQGRITLRLAHSAVNAPVEISSQDICD
jgi:hypothetical protein